MLSSMKRFIEASVAKLGAEAMSMATAFGLSLCVAGASAQTVPPISPSRLDGLTDAQIQSLVPSDWTPLRAATWNTALRPWFNNQAQVISELGKGDWDVIALQGVWSEAARDAILADQQVKAKYRASYWVPAEQKFAFCSFDLPRGELEDLLSCVIVSGAEPRHWLQPSPGYDPFCGLLELGIAFRGQQLCLECIKSTLQKYPATKSPFDVIDECYFTGGVKYSHGGSPGLLLLSKTTIDNVQVARYETNLEARAVVYATVKGVRLAVSHFPNNYFEDVLPGAGFLNTGAQQPQFAQDIIAAAPKLVLGSFNSGPDYQSAAANLFATNGYKPITTKSTFCPPSIFSAFTPCRYDMSPTASPDGQRSIDNIYQSPNGVSCVEHNKLGDVPVSDHLGVGAICMVKK